jgi:hypothetical protein
MRKNATVEDVPAIADRMSQETRALFRETGKQISDQLRSRVRGS